MGLSGRNLQGSCAVLWGIQSSRRGEGRGRKDKKQRNVLAAKDEYLSRNYEENMRRIVLRTMSRRFVTVLWRRVACAMGTIEDVRVAWKTQQANLLCRHITVTCNHGCTHSPHLRCDMEGLRAQTRRFVLCDRRSTI